MFAYLLEADTNKMLKPTQCDFLHTLAEEVVSKLDVLDVNRVSCVAIFVYVFQFFSLFGSAHGVMKLNNTKPIKES